MRRNSWALVVLAGALSVATGAVLPAATSEEATEYNEVPNGSLRTEDAITEVAAHFKAEASDSTTESNDFSSWPTLSVGSKVVRGPHWIWGDQGSNTTGTVLKFAEPGFAAVHWDDNHGNVYRYGFKGMYDIKPVDMVDIPEDADSTTAVSTSTTEGSQYVLATGTFVQRGRDWRWGDQDHGTIGTVEGPAATPGWFLVRWSDGTRNSYRYGAGGKFDLEIASTDEVGTEETTQESMPELQVGDKVVRGKDWRWGSQDAGKIGTVTKVDEDHRLVRVRWADGTRNNYHYGRKGFYDVRPATSEDIQAAAQETTETPLAEMPELKKGDRVVKGRDWQSGHQTADTLGIVTSNLTAGNMVEVHWAGDGHSAMYRYGAEGKYDVQLATLDDIQDFINRPDESRTLKPGDVVIRKMPWEWSNETNNPVGMVLDTNMTSSLWVHVLWVDPIPLVTLCRSDDLKYFSSAITRQTSEIDPALSSTGSTTSNVASSTTEAPVDPASMPALKVGDKVVQGSSWRFGDQGNGTLGTVAEETNKQGWVRVDWADGHSNSYRYGRKGKFDVRLATEDEVQHLTSLTVPTSTVPSLVGLEERLPAKMNPGDRVVKGPTWMWSAQDAGTVGTVKAAHVPGWVFVKWADGTKREYRYQPSKNLYDVQLANADDEAKAAEVAVSEGLWPAIKKGDRVVRRSTWTTGNESNTTVGTVVGNGVAGWYKVQWDDGATGSHRYGYRNVYEIQLAGSQVQDVSTSTTTTTTTEESTVSTTTAETTTVTERVIRFNGIFKEDS